MRAVLLQETVRFSLPPVPVNQAVACSAGSDVLLRGGESLLRAHARESFHR
jgi:hypothetical protein